MPESDPSKAKRTTEPAHTASSGKHSPPVLPDKERAGCLPVRLRGVSDDSLWPSRKCARGSTLVVPRHRRVELSPACRLKAPLMESCDHRMQGNGERLNLKLQIPAKYRSFACQFRPLCHAQSLTGRSSNYLPTGSGRRNL